LTISEQGLTAAVHAGDLKKVVALFRGSTQAERRALRDRTETLVAELVAEWERQQEVVVAANYAKNLMAERDRLDGPLRAAVLADTAATGEPERLRQTYRARMLADHDGVAHVVDLLEIACLPKLAEWAESILGFGTARFTRRLIRRGLIESPTSESYLVGLIALPRSLFVLNLSSDTRPQLVDALRADPHLLGGDIWRLFAFDGNRDFSFANYSSEWEPALLTLCEEGLLSRDRLLDETLAALGCDFIQHRAGFFSRLHEALKPSVEERATRVETYMGLLPSAIPPTVTFAVKALKVLQKARRLDPLLLIDQIEPALTHRAKGTAKAALKLLGAASQQAPELASRAACVGLTATTHESPDVQVAALDLLERRGEASDLDLFAAVQAVRSALTPSLRSRAATWLGSSTKDEERSPKRGGSKKAHERKGKTKPLSRSRVISPPNSIEVLVDRCAFVLENPGEIETFEQVLAGISRFSDHSPAASALLKRAKKLAKLDSPYESPVRYHLANLVLAWLQRGLPKTWRATREPPNLEHSLYLRLRAIAVRAAVGEARPLLSRPTHRRAWIEPVALVERLAWWQQTKNTPDSLDLVLALLRLAPEGRSAGLASAKRLSGEVGRVVRAALGSKEKAGESKALWLAVTPRPRRLEPLAKGGVEVLVSPGLSDKTPPDHLAELLHAPRVCVYEFRNTTALTRWIGTIWPGNLEPYFADGVRSISANIDWWEANWTQQAFLEPLLDPDTSLGPMARWLIAIGLAAKEPGQSRLATEAFITTVDDHRLDPTELGATMATLLPCQIVKAARWARTLGEAARASEAHSEAVCVAIAHALRGDSKLAPKDIGALLELFYEQLIETRGVLEEGDEARLFLAGLKTGKAGKLAKKILELVP